ncbi:helix-turn-helix transcriptional regulator [Staphylospora marina]|uniref:helix-turn-helix transcriptional regulator n=1 Tax=Staphylospora marina TaxID=2490858 RepID=UPI000F5C053A|nr:WYL domain-containing protein [Staphylospora marina]
MEYSGKLRMLKVLRILERDTDPEHRLTLKEIAQKLKHELLTDELPGKKALESDIHTLVEAGYDILWQQRGNNGANEYWLNERNFETYQLRMLIDAIMFSMFITKGDAMDLIDRLLEPVSIHEAKKLKEPCKLMDYVPRTRNRKLKYFIDTLYTAINERKEVRFRYGKYGPDKKFHYHQEGRFYVARPYALVWWENKYYLVAEYLNEPDFRHFRVDRMDNVQIVGEKSFEPKPLNIGEYVRTSFHMFNGEEKVVKLEFEDNERNDFLNMVFDRFGMDVNVEPREGHRFVLKVKAKVSQGLINWILTWGSRVKVLEPSELVEQVRAETEKLYRKYHS